MLSWNFFPLDHKDGQASGQDVKSQKDLGTTLTWNSEHHTSNTWESGGNLEEHWKKLNIFLKGPLIFRVKTIVPWIRGSKERSSQNIRPLFFGSAWSRRRFFYHDSDPG